MGTFRTINSLISVHSIEGIFKGISKCLKSISKLGSLIHSHINMTKEHLRKSANGGV